MRETDGAAPVDFRSVQAHYDLSDAFFQLFLDPSLTYSCAYFPTGRESLAEAQTAKIDLSLGKLRLEADQRLLDIGCGWGSVAARARSQYRVRVVGLTLSQHQYAYARQRFAHDPQVEIRLEGWETFAEPCDQIVSIGAFEHFTPAKYDAFFARCHQLLAPDGRMLLHTITTGRPNPTFTFARWAHFISRQIFPGGKLPHPEQVVSHARLGGFELLHAESLRPHYARTLDLWAANLAQHQAEAVQLTSEETYQTYQSYLTSCADHFRTGEINVYQFLFQLS